MKRPDPLSEQRRRDWALARLAQDYAMLERLQQAERYSTLPPEPAARPAPSRLARWVLAVIVVVVLATLARLLSNYLAAVWWLR